MARGGQGGGPECPLTAKILLNIWKKRKNWEKEGKNREERAKIRKVLFTLPLLTDRAGYATDPNTVDRQLSAVSTLKIIDGSIC